MSDDHVPAARWELEHGAILADDDVEAGQVSSDVMEIGQPASRDQDDHDAAPARLTDRLADGRIEHAVDGDGAVVVESKGREFHGFSSGPAGFGPVLHSKSVSGPVRRFPSGDLCW